MGDKLECALGHGRDESVDAGDIERTGGEDSDGTFGGGETFFLDNAMKAGFETPEKDDLGATDVGRIGSGVEAPDGFEGIADGVNSGCLRRTQHGAEDPREHMQVFVGIYMREAETVALEQRNLCCGLGLDLGGANAGSEKTLQEAARGWMEYAGVAIDKGADGTLIGDRRAINQDDVTAHAKRWRGQSHPDGVFGGRSLRHDRRAGEDSSTVQFEYGAVDTRSYPEIVGIHDETGHEDKLINPGV